MGSMAYEHPLLQELEIKSLLCRERYYRDTAQWQKLRDCYHPDAGRTRVEISWYDPPLHSSNNILPTVAEL